MKKEKKESNLSKLMGYSGNYKIWQFCQTGIVSGINGNVDINVMYE